ncbi:FecR family protein [Mucilaginibacter sp. L196]|uniref:FecR family protein n=1 Tax=Mucilaginibacter sp. L196 TaxID=1641870 RepID=UPI00131CECD2|nr:FecR family protein [Mucilaginibacter sp. L196]
MQEQELKELLKRIRNGTATDEEKALLDNWYLQYRGEESTDYLLDERIKDANAIWAELQPVVSISQQKKLWPRIAAAAAILAFLSFGLYQYLHKNKIPKTEYANDIAPGTGKPYLTLANGQKIVLGNSNAIVAKQGGVTIQQDTTGKVSYTANNSRIADAPYNTLTNPRGGKLVSLVLPDGTLAKLEAASSITYQTVFTGRTRNVTITGKVYFAVNYNKHHPFYATTKGQVTEDLGTHFIVEAFDDEPTIKTTLIEGSVSVSKDGHKVLLKPGQQTLAATTLKAQQADLDHETAWINGDLDFNNQDLHSIMRELARVYNIDVSYKGEVENMVLNGIISRSHNISAVLEMFEATNNVHFEINERRVMVIAGQR